ncbi:MAG: ABC-F family ATP-binding cassette domain-containing protein [Myxococcota bacterium]
MPVLTAQGLSRSYGAQVVLDDVSVAVHSGERVGLVGRNGSGKSTLARILAGEEAPDTGTLAHRRDARVAYLSQEPSFEGDPTARAAVLEGLGAWRAARARHEALSEALARGEGEVASLLDAQAAAAADIERLGGWELEHRAEAVLGHLGVTRQDQSVATMSGGERRRVALARLLVSQPDLAILDEPTNHLDADTVEWLERHLSESFPGALLLITHDRYLLDRVATRTLELDGGRLYSYDGGWEAYLTAKAERQAHEARTEANRRNFLRRELEWLRRQPKARTGKQKARVQRAEAAQTQAPSAAPRTVELAVQETRTGGTVLELDHLSLEVGGERLVRDLDWVLTPGERVGVVGPNGAGKTSLLRAVVGELPPVAGRVVLGSRTRVAYLAQTRSVLDDGATIAENVAGQRREVDFHGRTLHVRSYLERFLFESSRMRQPVGSLSGGERARVALAKLLLEPANVLLLDEPTNDLDVDTLAALEQMLVDFDGAVIVVTHDRYFLDRVATAILAFEGNGEVVRYAGNYSSYRAQREAFTRARAGAAEAAGAAGVATHPERAATAAPTAAAKRSSRPALTYAERLELEAIVARIEEAEAEVARLEAAVADPALYRDRQDEITDVLAHLEAARDHARQLIERWEELETKREESSASQPS